MHLCLFTSCAFTHTPGLPSSSSAADLETLDHEDKDKASGGESKESRGEEINGSLWKDEEQGNIESEQKKVKVRGVERAS